MANIYNAYFGIPEFKNYVELSYNKKDNWLSELAYKNGTDKGYIGKENATFFNLPSHSYTDIYYILFNHCKDYIKNFFELGIGTTDESISSNMTKNGIPGASLKMWKEYFKNANIYGADIDSRVLFNDERIKTFYVDELEKDSIASMWKKIPEDMDVILDDGLHNAEANILFFENSFFKLKDGGIYIIEDIYPTEIYKISNYLQENGHNYVYFNMNVPEDGCNNDKIVIVFKEQYAQ